MTMEQTNEKPSAKIFQFPQGKDLENRKAVKAMEKDIRDNAEKNKQNAKGFTGERSVFDKYYDNPNEGNTNERLQFLTGLQGDRSLTPALYLDICKKTLPRGTYEHILCAIMDVEIYDEFRKDPERASLIGVLDAYFEIMNPKKTF